MTSSEFKSWFEGYTESIEDAPTVKQWARVKDRVAEINGQAVTERVFVDRYLPSVPYQPYWVAAPTVTTAGFQTNNTFCSNSAMLSLGKAEAALAN